MIVKTPGFQMGSPAAAFLSSGLWREGENGSRDWGETEQPGGTNCRESVEIKSVAAAASEMVQPFFRMCCLLLLPVIDPHTPRKINRESTRVRKRWRKTLRETAREKKVQKYSLSAVDFDLMCFFQSCKTQLATTAVLSSPDLFFFVCLLL